ncbi:MAG TPA: hypothetical protein VL625_09780, partial [Patescibacteria group bacterium]|nr:hypothetical protein [Patescibacteria group bacterium]
MTQDGKPSRINEIRLFFSPDATLPPLKAISDLDGHEEAKTFTRRMMWWLNGENYSCGPWAAVYLVLTPALAPGKIRITDEGTGWWNRYALAGVPADFAKAPNAPDIVRRAVVDALRTIRPDLYDLVNGTEKTVRTHGDDLRFLMQTRITKRSTIELYFSLPAPPATSLLFTGFTDAKTGVFLESPALDTGVIGAPLEYNAKPVGIAEIEKMTDILRTKKRPVLSKL